MKEGGRSVSPRILYFEVGNGGAPVSELNESVESPEEDIISVEDRLTVSKTGSRTVA